MPGDPSHTEFGEDLAYVNQVSQELLRVSDRARAVLLGAEIDRYLRQMLETYFLPKAPRSGRLLEGSGPVGTFTARIEVAYRLGLLRPEWHHDLQIISQIRNEFAHGPAGMTLNKQSVSDLWAKQFIVSRSRTRRLRNELFHSPCPLTSLDHDLKLFSR